MELIRDVRQMRLWSLDLRREGKRISFVPTMGFLHEGHLSLIRAARKAGDAVVVSIFVNPTQFGPQEDLDAYPRDLDRDMALCREEGVDLIYHPEPGSIYPEGFQTYVEVEGVSRGLCGASRPGHFRGVATVVAKLFNQVVPHAAFFGMKDYQQVAVIRRMVRDLDMDVEVVGCPTVRESDGLAMSSRNVYLSPEGRKAALCLHRSILLARKLLDEGVRESSEITEKVTRLIGDEPLARIDYVEIRHPDTLEPLPIISERGVLLLAVRVEKARLIDNGLLPE